MAGFPLNLPWNAWASRQFRELGDMALTLLLIGIAAAALGLAIFGRAKHKALGAAYLLLP